MCLMCSCVAIGYPLLKSVFHIDYMEILILCVPFFYVSDIENESISRLLLVGCRFCPSSSRWVRYNSFHFDINLLLVHSTTNSAPTFDCSKRTVSETRGRCGGCWQGARDIDWRQWAQIWHHFGSQTREKNGVESFRLSSSLLSFLRL